MPFLNSSPTGARVFLDAFRLGYGIGERKKEQNKEDAISDAYGMLSSLEDVSTETDDIGVSAIPNQPALTSKQKQLNLQQREAIRSERGTDVPITTAKQQLAEQVGNVAEFDAPQKVMPLQDLTALRIEARRKLRDAKVSGKDIAQFDNDFNAKLKSQATKYRDLAINAWQTGNFKKAEQFIEQSYQFIPDGADVTARFVPDGQGGSALALAFQDSTTGDATLEHPMLVTTPEQFLSLSGRAIDFTEQLELDKSLQALRLNESAEGRAQEKHRQDNYIFNQTKDLVVAQKQADLIKTYVTTRQGEAQLAIAAAKVAASAANNGWGGSGDGKGSSFLTAEKELSKQIDTLFANSGRVPEEKIQQRKLVGAAFLQANAGAPVSEIANVGLNYGELQDQARAQAEQLIASDPNFIQLSQDSQQYKAAVRQQMFKIMAPHHEVIDGQTYFKTDSGIYKVPDRFSTGRRTTTTYTDIYTQMQAQVSNDPALRRLAEVAGVQPSGTAISANVSSSARGQQTRTTEPTPSPTPKPAPQPRPGTALPPPNISAEGIAQRTGNRSTGVRDNDPINRGMLPERSVPKGVPGVTEKVTDRQAVELNNSLRKVRAFAVRGTPDPKLGRPTGKDLRNALNHPGTTPSEKEAIRRILKSATSRPNRRGRGGGQVRNLTAADV